MRGTCFRGLSGPHESTACCVDCSPARRALPGSLRDHPTAALAVGVDVRKWRAIAFAVSAATVGAAGAINTGLTHFVSPDSFPIFLSLSLLVGVALAGPSWRVGIFVAAVFLSFVPDD